MKRSAVSLLAVVLLFLGTIVAERALQLVERSDPLGRQVLYLPSAEMLHLGSLGNPGLVADMLYLWSIQYYSRFQPHERFLYLETIYNLITDLDPLYADAYRIGALIMQIQTSDDESHKQAVIRLFDKALRNMPANHEIAEAAAWDLYIRYRDTSEAVRYLEAGSAMPGAPHRLQRALTVWRETEGDWSIDDALLYWSEVREGAVNDYDRAVCERQIYRLIATRDEEKLDPVLQNWTQLKGSCPATWQEVIDAGWINQIPMDYFGNPYRILPDTCSTTGLDSVRFD